MLYRSVLVDIATTILLYGAYFLLAGEVSATECVAGAIAVPATVAFILARRWTGGGRLALTAPAATFLRPLAALMPDTVRVGGALALAIRFGPPGDRGVSTPQQPRPPEPAGSKGIRILSQSLTPKSFVLQDADGGEILHRLTPGALEGDAG